MSDLMRWGASLRARNASASRSIKRRSAFVVSLENAFAKRSFGWSAREALYRHLSVQLNNDVTLLAALEAFAQRLQRRRKALNAVVISDVIRKVKDGRSLGMALDTWAPSDEVVMVASGESAGTLPVILDALLNAKDKITKVRQAAIGAMITPGIYLVALCGMLWSIGAFFLPSISQTIPREQVTGLGASLYTMGDFANSPWALLPVVMLVIAIAVAVWSMPRWTGIWRVRIEAYFPWSFYRDINGYLWLLGFACLLSAGQADVGILDVQARRASPWLRERLRAVRRRMQNGASLAEALQLSGFGFPNPDMIDEIESMASFRDFPVRIARVADRWATELERRTKGLVKTLGWTFDIIIYAVMGYILAAMNSMSGQMGSVPIN